MKIVVLDGYALNPGDLSWNDLEVSGECRIYDYTKADETINRAKEADVVFTNKTVLSSAIINQLPNLKYIGVLATGYNVVDIEEARKKKITVTNIPAYGTDSVAQMVFAHLLNLTQRVEYHAKTVAGGRWSSSRDFCYWDVPLIELKDLTMGIIGIGRIGQAVARLALAFGMKVLATDLQKPSSLPEGIKFVALEELLKQSDVISLHCPLTKETEKVINAERLSLMKKTAFLINTSRGPLIDEPALANALNSGRIAGAGLDVLSVEPPKTDNPLLKAKNCFITPHIAWATKAARKRLMDIAVKNLKEFIENRPVNVVNR
jgi:glycerate dehydrogenase